MCWAHPCQSIVPEDAPHHCSHLSAVSLNLQSRATCKLPLGNSDSLLWPLPAQKLSERAPVGQSKAVPGTAPDNEPRSLSSTPARGAWSWCPPGNGTAPVLGRDHWNPPSPGCELKCCGFPLLWAQNKIVLAWAALSFPLQSSNGLTKQRSHQHVLILITEEANDPFWECFTGQILLSLLCDKLISCNNLILREKNLFVWEKKSAFHGTTALWLQIHHHTSSASKVLKLHVCLPTSDYTYIICVF